MISETLGKSVLVCGCGNVLFGDDGFGPAVVEYLQANYDLPPEVLVQDVGTSIREILFDLALADAKPRLLIIVDAVDHPGRTPGEVFEISAADLPTQKVADFSLHQFPTVNLLQELQEGTALQVHIVVAQVSHIPEAVQPGLSEAVARAVPVAARHIAGLINAPDRAVG
jgi:coenzyme F420 hydrogenase subunit delta